MPPALKKDRYDFFFIRDTKESGGPASDPSSLTVNTVSSSSQVSMTFLPFCLWVHSPATP